MKTAYPSVASNQGLISISWPLPIRKRGRVGVCRQGSVAYGRGRYGTRVFRTVPPRWCLCACSRRAAVERLQSCPLRNNLDLSASSKYMHVSANLNLYLNRTGYHLFAWNGVGHMLCLPYSFSKAPGLPRERPHPAYRVTKSGHALLKHRCMIRVRALRRSTRIIRLTQMVVGAASMIHTWSFKRSNPGSRALACEVRHAHLECRFSFRIDPGARG